LQGAPAPLAVIPRLRRPGPASPAGDDAWPAGAPDGAGGHRHCPRWMCGLANGRTDVSRCAISNVQAHSPSWWCRAGTAGVEPALWPGWSRPAYPLADPYVVVNAEKKTARQVLLGAVPAYPLAGGLRWHPRPVPGQHRLQATDAVIPRFDCSATE